MAIFQIDGQNKSGNDFAKKIFPTRYEIGALSAIKPASLSDPMKQLLSTQGWPIRLFQNLQINATVVFMGANVGSSYYCKIQQKVKKLSFLTTQKFPIQSFVAI